MARLEGWAEEIFNGSGWRQAYYRRGQQVRSARYENPLKCHHFMDKCTTLNMSSGWILSGVHAKWMWRDRMGVGWRSCLETHGRSWGFWLNNCKHNLWAGWKMSPGWWWVRWRKALRRHDLSLSWLHHRHCWTVPGGTSEGWKGSCVGKA